MNIKIGERIIVEETQKRQKLINNLLAGKESSPKRLYDTQIMKKSETRALESHNLYEN
jgi:hypothetical protein